MTAQARREVAHYASVAAIVIVVSHMVGPRGRPGGLSCMMSCTADECDVTGRLAVGNGQQTVLQAGVVSQSSVRLCRRRKEECHHWLCR